MNYLIMFTVDTNDADYVSETKLVDEESLRFICKIYDKVIKFEPYNTQMMTSISYIITHRHNWPSEEMIRTDLGEKSPMEIYGLSEEDYESFRDYLPYPANGFHSITQLSIYEVVGKKDYKDFL